MSRLVCLACLVSAMTITTIVASGCQTKKPPLIQPRWATLPPKKVPEFLKGTIVELCDTFNTEPQAVNNFGLVVNLKGTGDAYNVNNDVKDYIVKTMAKHGIGSARTAGLEGSMPDEWLRDPRNAIVRVDALIPAGARVGQRIDVAVSALPGSNTSSLAGGMLYRTELKERGADPRLPGVGVKTPVIADGQVFVNPVYALADPNADPTAKASLRFGTVLGGGLVQEDRMIGLRIREPSLKMSRAIEWRIQEGFHDTNVAHAYDEGIVQMYMPRSYDGDWEHFSGVATHLFFNSSAEFAANKAHQLAEEAQNPAATEYLLSISYCWEGLGHQALPYVVPLMSDPNPDVAFAAARAAAFLGDSSALTILMDMARSTDHPFQVAAVQVLGALPPSPVVSQMLRTLLDAPQTTVRIAAYQVLAREGDPAIYSRAINGKFFLDIIPSTGAPPLVWASRRGIPRLAIFGNKPAMELPATFSAMESRLTITSEPNDRAVKIFYRDPAVDRPTPILSNPDIAELVARLGGMTGEASQPGQPQQQLNFSYGDIVAILQAMSDHQQLVATANGRVMPAPFLIEQAQRVRDDVENAPVIPDRVIPERGRPQGDARATTEPSDQIGAAVKE
jgi:hypothetical protein